MAPCRRNPKGAGVFGPQALSFVGHGDYASFRSSFRACDPNTPARDPTDFHHGLLDKRNPGRLECRGSENSLYQMSVRGASRPIPRRWRRSTPPSCRSEFVPGSGSDRETLDRFSTFLNPGPRHHHYGSRTPVQARRNRMTSGPSRNNKIQPRRRVQLHRTLCGPLIAANNRTAFGGARSSDDVTQRRAPDRTEMKRVTGSEALASSAPIAPRSRND